MKKQKAEVSKSTTWMGRILIATFVVFLLIVMGSIGLDYLSGGDKVDYPAADSPF
jgi:hypothetical protein